MKKVLMIAYHFPPIGSIDTIWTLRYVRHLPSFGWYPHIITVRTGTRREQVDDTLLAHIPKGVTVTRTPYLDVTLAYRFLRGVRPRRIAQYISRFVHYFPPDHYVGWLPFAYLAARHIAHHEGADVIYTTYPYTTHLVGCLISRETGKPWVADFRDEWTQHPARQPLFAWQRSLDLWMEQRVLRTANKIITPTKSYQREMARLIPADMSNKFTTITNGFEPEDFEVPTKSNHEKFTIVYCGLFYDAQQPTSFLHALGGAVAKGRIARDKLKVILVGPRRTWRVAQFENGPLNGVVTCTGYVSHGEAIRYIKSADLLWLLVASERGKENIPGKTFEYIAAGRPILALVPPDGEAAALLRETRTAVAIVEPEDVEAIEKAISDLYTRWKSGDLHIEPNWAEIKRYEGKALTKRLSEILDEVCAV